jgi:flagellar motility protein MotE (MotC chaperone)
MKLPSLRVVPLLVVAAVPFLGIKLYDIVAALGSAAVQTAEAASPPPPSAAASGPAAKPPTAQSPPPATPQPSAGTATPVAAGDGDTASSRDPTSFSPAEIELLQKLSVRRNALDKRAAELDARAVMLKATEQRIADKIAELNTMQHNIDVSLKQKDQQQDKKLQNIVKIYELMKPEDAARIFEQLDMSVLIEVLANMKQAKAAPILADMQPEKAKAVTLALAERHPPASSAEP